MLKSIKKVMKGLSVPNVDRYEGSLLWRLVASLVLALDFVNHAAEFLESTIKSQYMSTTRISPSFCDLPLVLGASLASAVTEMSLVGLWFWLGDGFGNGCCCTLNFGTSLSTAVAEAGPIGLYHTLSVITRPEALCYEYLPGSASGCGLADA